MNIPMVDLKAEYALLEDEIKPALLAVLASAQYIGGPNVRALEQEVAAYCGVRHAIACACGTDALLLALRASGVGAGDEVITTPFTFVATASTISMCGARPVFVDIDPKTYNINPALIEAAITPRTRAVVAVHLFGQPADLAPIAAICRRYGLRLIEDAAQAFGAEYGGRKAGAFGDIGCFSFYPSKNLGAFGDGGMVITDDDELGEKLRILANHGSRVRYHHEVLGYNSRLDELQAAILRVKLKRVDAFNAARRPSPTLTTRAWLKAGPSPHTRTARGYTSTTSTPCKANGATRLSSRLPRPALPAPSTTLSPYTARRCTRASAQA